MITAPNGSSSGSTWINPVCRFAGDDWLDANANSLTYVVYAVPPVYGSDGVTIATPGQLRDLTGCTVAGTLEYQTPFGVLPAVAIGLVTMVGAIVGAPTSGKISLSLPAAQTIFPRQILTTVLDPLKALLVAQPRILDSTGKAITVGRQPVFVF